VAADVQAASAQNESFFQERYCARIGGVPSWLNCAYKTLAQCNMIIEPMRYCLENPFWHGGRRSDHQGQGSVATTDIIARRTHIGSGPE